KKKTEADRALELAQTAFGEGNYEEALRRADQAGALDAGRAEAQKLRDDSDAKIQAEKAAAAARRKPTAKPAVQTARRAPATGSEARAEKGTAARPATAPASAPASGNGTLRLLFNSPMSEGNVMVAVNNHIPRARPFTFKQPEQ